MPRTRAQRRALASSLDVDSVSHVLSFLPELGVLPGRVYTAGVVAAQQPAAPHGAASLSRDLSRHDHTWRAQQPDANEHERCESGATCWLKARNFGALDCDLDVRACVTS